MKEKLNTYFALLFVTIFGSLAAFAIVDVATTDVIASATNSANQQTYAVLQESILRNRL